MPGALARATIPSFARSIAFPEMHMAHRTVAAILILIATIMLALPAGARQKSVAPTWWSAPRRGGFTPPRRGKLAATGADSPARAPLQVSATTAASSDREPPNAKRPINQIQVFALLAGQLHCLGTTEEPQSVWDAKPRRATRFSMLWHGGTMQHRDAIAR
jgi:hypothetical protein